jgi:hypothetical protein
MMTGHSNWTIDYETSLLNHIRKFIGSNAYI